MNIPSLFISFNTLLFTFHVLSVSVRLSLEYFATFSDYIFITNMADNFFSQKIG